MKVNSLQANRWLVAALSASIFSGLCIGEKPLSKGGKNEMKPHPDNPQAQGPQKTALTQEVSPLLPRGPRLEIKRKNYIDDYIFGKMERDKIPHAGLATDQEFFRLGRGAAGFARRRRLEDLGQAGRSALDGERHGVVSQIARFGLPREAGAVAGDRDGCRRYSRARRVCNGAGDAGRGGLRDERSRGQDERGYK